MLRALARTILLAAVVLTTAPPEGHAESVRPMESVLRARPTDRGNVVVEFCEVGDCRAIGRETGYTREQWKEIRSICKDEGYYGKARKTLLATIGFLGGTAVGGPTAGMMSSSAIHFLSDGVSVDAYVTAGITLPGLLSDGTKFVLSIRDLVNLIDGIDACAATWEWQQTPQYKRYNNGYARPLG